MLLEGDGNLGAICGNPDDFLLLDPPKIKFKRELSTKRNRYLVFVALIVCNS